MQFVAKRQTVNDYVNESGKEGRAEKTMFLSYLFVFLLAAVPLFELVAVIPLAIFGGLSPVPTAVLAFLGNLVTVILVIVFVDKVKKWMQKRKNRKQRESSEQGAATLEDDDVKWEESKRQKRARSIFDKYGLPGLAIIGPFFVGSHISAFMGMSFGSERKSVTSWMVISLVFWTLITAAAASYGVSYFMPHVEEDGVLIRLFQS
ncbi:Uncharacterized membrane protein [Alteribacillus persepolensis]|uniref:Uncharacterized membrane protein n=1 Tax=Alteribacillus persepolensis TaxID=568899 RepID=A0A1G8EB59_9BACI|nr:small multi-drug export protein [Alteribacillus persepolensis]SDH67126.1 Uncharacterized membrane protein [Alteribacillus persepolensis]